MKHHPISSQGSAVPPAERKPGRPMGTKNKPKPEVRPVVETVARVVSDAMSMAAQGHLHVFDTEISLPIQGQHKLVVTIQLQSTTFGSAGLENRQPRESNEAVVVEKEVRQVG